MIAAPFLLVFQQPVTKSRAVSLPRHVLSLSEEADLAGGVQHLLCESSPPTDGG